MKNAAAIVLVSGLASMSCRSYETLDRATVVTCVSSAECPDGLVCNRGKCTNPNSIDTTPPDVVSGTVSLAPARLMAGQTFHVAFQVSEPLAQVPAVTLALGVGSPPALACDEITADDHAHPSYRCAYTVTTTGSENGGQGGDIGVNVHLRDLAGNDTFRSSIASVAFDFAPPVPTVASVAYEPDLGNPLPSVLSAKAGTVISVAVSANEPLSASATAALVGTSGSATLPFTSWRRGAGPGDLVFEVEVQPGQPDGIYALEVTWMDEVGNLGTSALGDTRVSVRTSPPTLVVDQGALVFVRSPQGSGAAERFGSHEVPAGPYFAVEPDDPLAGTTTLPPGSLRLADASPLSAVVVMSSDAPTALNLGTLYSAGGVFPRRPLVSPDLMGVWLVGVDEAGNRSSPVKLERSELVITPRTPDFGSAPFALTITPVARPVRSVSAGVQPANPSLLAARDGDGQRVVSGPAWTKHVPSTGPAELNGIAFDIARGRLVAVGAVAYGDVPIWEWDGDAWTQVSSSGSWPRGRHGEALFYDRNRDRIEMMGGWGRTGEAWNDRWEWNGSTWEPGPAPTVYPAALGSAVHAPLLQRAYASDGYSRSFWEWDGTTWNDLTPAAGAPGPRGGQLAFDSRRRRLLSFGGYDGTAFLPEIWQWDGAAWSQVDVSGPHPSPRGDVAVAYDERRDRVVLFGGLNDPTMPPGVSLGDTWEWDGTAWRDVTPTEANPPARLYASMTYDPSRATVIMGGGTHLTSTDYASLTDWWEWDGTRWREITTSDASPAARTGAGMVFDPDRGVTLFFGNYSFSDTWEWDGARWIDRTAGTAPPTSRSDPGLVYDSVRRRVVMFGGMIPLYYRGDTWEWDGTTWSLASTSGPNPRRDHAMAFDSVRGRTILFGGFGDLRQYGNSGTFGDMWEWDGAVWTTLTPAGGMPSKRSGHSMVHDPVNGITLLFGGKSGAYLQDTWEWDGSSWTELHPAVSPPARAYHRMFLDSTRGRIVVRGGTGDVGALADEWEWVAGSWRLCAASSTGLTVRAGEAVAYDSRRGRLEVFGGTDPILQTAGGDLWERSLSSARTPAFQLDVSVAPAGVIAARVVGLAVRAYAGATYSPGALGETGASLLGWSLLEGGWVEIDRNTAGVTAAAPLLPDSAAAQLLWRSGDPTAARRFVGPVDRTLSFQVRPAGSAALEFDGAAVALDYVEVRVRYAVP